MPVNSQCWNLIWSFDTATKVNHFIWKCISDIAPTLKALNRRRIVEESSCSFCGLDESIEHAVIECERARCIWYSFLGLRIDRRGVSSIDKWLMELLDKKGLKGEERKRIGRMFGAIWHIWKERCHAVYEGHKPCVEETMQRLNKALAEYKYVQVTYAERVKLRKKQFVQEDKKWTKPAGSCIKINCDAAICENGMNAGIAAVARDSLGSVVAGQCMKIRSVSTLQAEAMAVKLGLQIATEKGFNEVILEMDSRMLHDSISGKMTSHWQIKDVCSDIRKLQSAMKEVRLSWVPREANCCSDWLAKLVLKEMCPFDWIQNIPYSLKVLLDKDRKVAVNTLVDDSFVIEPG